MKSVLDPLFLRRPKLDYISPPICEVIFSASGFPIIVLSPINKHKGPTGLVLSGRGKVTLRWNNYPGALCFNIYQAEVQALVGPCACTDTLVLIAECQSFPEFTITDYGCYYVTAITEDGESDFSDPICFNHNSFQPDCDPGLVWDPTLFACVCPAQPCLPSQVWDFTLCQCVNCPVEPCLPGFHWDAATCTCVPDGPSCEGFIDSLPDFSVEDFSDKGFAVGAGDGGNLPWVYHNRVLQNIDPPLTVYSPPGFGSMLVAGGENFAGGYEFDDTFTNIAAFTIDQAAPSIQIVGTNFVDGNEASQNEMNSSGNIAWADFFDGGTGTVFSKFYNYGLNSFTADIQHPNLGTFGARETIARHIGDDDSVLVEVAFGPDAPSFANQVRAMRWKAGIFTDIHPGTTANEDALCEEGWINASGHVSCVLVTTFTTYRPFINLGGVTSFLEADAANEIGKTCINDNDVVVWDRLGTNEVKMWDAINGVQVLPVAGRLGPPFTGSPQTKFKVINNEGVVIGTRNGGGGFVYKDGVVYNIIDLLPLGHGWTSIDEGWAIVEDNYVLGRGVLSGTPRTFVAKLCF